MGTNEEIEKLPSKKQIMMVLVRTAFRREDFPDSALQSKRHLSLFTQYLRSQSTKRSK